MNGWVNQLIGANLGLFKPAQGQFSLDITTPSDVQVPSNASLQITANIVRSGPIGELSTSQDMTSDNIQTRIIFDTSAPEVVSLSIYDPGGLTPADNHIWISGQDIPTKQYSTMLKD